MSTLPSGAKIHEVIGESQLFQKFWIGTQPGDCDLCHSDFGKVMYDCGIPLTGGRWGNICEACFVDEGCKTGTGFGQRYERQPDNRWLKTRG
jgi:hypothetical protein